MSQQFNPLAPLSGVANAARQGIEQLNVTKKALSDAIASTASSLLTALPGAPGGPGNGGGRQGAGVPGLPTPQNLFPAEAVNAVSQIEEVAIPQGLPRPSQMLGLRGRRRARVGPVAETETPAERQPAAPPARLSTVRERRGY